MGNKQTTIIENQLIGSFYFRRTPNGNLIGEFTNFRTPIIITESANLAQNEDVENDDVLIGHEFLGKYNCSWRQNNDVFRLTLEIRRVPNANQKFELEWTNESGDIEYSGQGFMAEDLLAGFYVQGTIPEAK